MRELSKTVSVQMLSAGAATAGTAINSTGIAMAGYHGVMFFGRFATANAGNFASLAGSATLGGTYVDLKDTKVVPGDNGDIWMIDLKRPLPNFVRAEIVRAGADTVTGDVYAILYGARKSNPGHQSIIDAETHIDPIDGTI